MLKGIHRMSMIRATRSAMPLTLDTIFPWMDSAVTKPTRGQYGQQCLRCAFPTCHTCKRTRGKKEGEVPKYKHAQQISHKGNGVKVEEKDEWGRHLWYCKESCTPRECENAANSIARRGKLQPSSNYGRWKSGDIKKICNDCLKPTCHQSKERSDQETKRNNPGWVGDGYWYCEKHREGART